MLNLTNVGGTTPKKRVRLRRRIQSVGGDLGSEAPYNVTLNLIYGSNMGDEKVVLFHRNKETQVETEKSFAYHIFSGSNEYTYMKNFDNVSVFPSISLKRGNQKSKHIIYGGLHIPQEENVLCKRNYYISFDDEPTVDRSDSDFIIIENRLEDENKDEWNISNIIFTQNDIRSLKASTKFGETQSYNPGLSNGNDGIYLGITEKTVVIDETIINKNNFKSLTGSNLDGVFCAIDFEEKKGGTITITVSKLEGNYTIDVE